MTEERTLRVEAAGDVVTITLDRADRLNAQTASSLRDLASALRAAAQAAPRVLVLRGAGRAFCSGADLAPAEEGDPAAAATVATIDAANDVVRAVRAFPAPIVAVVHGPCAGVGVSLALAADLTVMGESAYLLLAFTRIGLMPDGGASALVSAAVGRSRAMRMALLAERIGAAEAERWGLVSHCVPDGSLGSTVDEIVGTLAAGPTAAYLATRGAVNDATLTELEAAFVRERDGQSALLASADFAEGVRAFRERATPTFPRR